MIARSVSVSNPSGLHARLASLFCAKSKLYSSQIVILAGQKLIPARSILEMMAANIRFGQTIVIHCDGADETAALDDLTHFLLALTE